MLLRADGPGLDDPRWVNLGNPTRDRKSFNCQPSSVVQLEARGHGKPFFMLCCDNWVHGGRHGLANASYIWLPLFFHNSTRGKRFSIPKLSSWSVTDPFKDISSALPRVLGQLRLNTTNTTYGMNLSFAGNSSNRTVLASSDALLRAGKVKREPWWRTRMHLNKRGGG